MILMLETIKILKSSKSLMQEPVKLKNCLKKFMIEVQEAYLELLKEIKKLRILTDKLN